MSTVTYTHITASSLPTEVRVALEGHSTVSGSHIVVSQYVLRMLYTKGWKPQEVNYPEPEKREVAEWGIRELRFDADYFGLSCPNGWAL